MYEFRHNLTMLSHLFSIHKGTKLNKTHRKKNPPDVDVYKIKKTNNFKNLTFDL